MKIKRNFYIFLIIICIFFMITSVSANENQTSITNPDNSNQQIINENIKDNSGTIDKTYKTGNALSNKSIKNLHEDLVDCNGTLNMNQDYIYEENDGKYSNYGVSNLVINGNNHTIDGTSSEHSFTFYYGTKIGNGTNNDRKTRLTINDVTFKNFNTLYLDLSGYITFNNVKIINCTGFNDSAILSFGPRSNAVLNNTNIDANTNNSFISLYTGNLSVFNSTISSNEGYGGAIEVNRGQLIIENCTFTNLHSKNGAMLNYKGDAFSIKNSVIKNSNATFNGGAIIAKFFTSRDSNGTIIQPKGFVIENCVFANLSATHDGGAIFIDLDSASNHIVQSLNIVNSTFTDITSRYGGAIAIQGGSLNINNSLFYNNSATFEGGALFTTWTNVNIYNTTLYGNTAEYNAGAIYFDKGKLTIKSNK